MAPSSGEAASGSGDIDSSGDFGSGSGDGGSGLSGDMASGSGETPSLPPPTIPPAPPASPPPPDAFELAVAAANQAGPAFTIASSSVGAARLLVDGASPLQAIPPPYLVRIGVGLPRQEDLVVDHVAPLHNGTEATAADGRYALHLAAPARHYHTPGEALRHVHRQATLATRFAVHAGGGDASFLFDCRLTTPDAPHLYDDGVPLELQLYNIAPEGWYALRAPAATRAALVGAATAAVRGWAAFAFDPSVVAASYVAIRLFSHRGGRRGQRGGGTDGAAAGEPAPFSRGGGGWHGGDAALERRPLVAALDLSSGLGYFSNVTEGAAGWVVRRRVLARSAARFPAARERGAPRGEFGDDAYVWAEDDGGAPLRPSERAALGLVVARPPTNALMPSRDGRGAGVLAGRGTELYARYSTTPFADADAALVRARAAAAAAIGPHGEAVAPSPDADVIGGAGVGDGGVLHLGAPWPPIDHAAVPTSVLLGEETGDDFTRGGDAEGGQAAPEFVLVSYTMEAAPDG